MVEVFILLASILAFCVLGSVSVSLLLKRDESRKAAARKKLSDQPEALFAWRICNIGALDVNVYCLELQFKGEDTWVSVADDNDPCVLERDADTLQLPLHLKKN